MTCDLNSLWQRFGRGGRGEGTEAVAILLAEKKHFDTGQEVGARAVNGRGGVVSKRRRDENDQIVEGPPGKKRVTTRTQKGTRQQGEPTGSNKRRTGMVSDLESTHPSKRPRLAFSETENGGPTTTVLQPSPTVNALDSNTSLNSRPKGTAQPGGSNV